MQLAITIFTDNSISAKLSRVLISLSNFNFIQNFEINLKNMFYLAVKFQKQLIVKKHLTTTIDNNTVDYLPSLCISASYANNLTSQYDVRMLLNDDRRVARTSLIETTYNIALFRIDLPPTNESSLSSSRSLPDSSRRLLDVKTSLIFNITSSIQPSDLVEFHNVKPGVYLVEVTH